WALLGSVVAVVAVLILLPLGVLVERSLGAAGLGYYRALTRDDGGVFLVAPIEAVGNSLRYALAATVIAVVIGGLAAAALTRRDAGR
ncbi:iron ABC transporter permease, partial [Streptomyces sp. SID10244]|nr:iron ABC transporter permease [Streptomyces sp. SID10244]